MHTSNSPGPIAWAERSPDRCCQPGLLSASAGQSVGVASPRSTNPPNTNVHAPTFRECSASATSQKKRPQEASPEAVPRSPFPLQVRASGTSVPRISTLVASLCFQKRSPASREGVKPGFRVFWRARARPCSASRAKYLNVWEITCFQQRSPGHERRAH